MLPKAARISNAADFRRVTRQGVRIGRPTLVLHATRTGEATVRVGFVVSKAVGNAVLRNRVRRRLRNLAAGRLPSTPGGIDVVVRALQRAAARPAEVTRDLPAAWATALARVAERATPEGQNA